MQHARDRDPRDHSRVVIGDIRSQKRRHQRAGRRGISSPLGSKSTTGLLLRPGRSLTASTASVAFSVALLTDPLPMIVSRAPGRSVVWSQAR